MWLTSPPSPYYVLGLVISSRLASETTEIQFIQLFLSFPFDSFAKPLNNDTADFVDQSLFAVKQDLYATANMSLKHGRQFTIFQMQWSQ